MSDRSIMRLVVALVLLAAAASAPQLRASLMTYTATGGAISGTLDGVPFEDASWSITATGDTAGITSGIKGGLIPYYYMPVSSVITISGFGPATFTSATFGVVSADYSGVLSPGYSGDGFIEWSSGMGFASLLYGGYNDLASPVTLSGNSVANLNTYPTSLGDLVITGDSGDPGTFIAAVPEVTTLLSGLVIAPLMLSRRKRHAAVA